MNTDKNEVTTTKERVIKASESYPDAKTVLEELFPEVFKEEWHDISKELQFEFISQDRLHFLKIYHGDSRKAEIGAIYPNTGVCSKGIYLYNDDLYKLECNNDAFRILKKW